MSQSIRNHRHVVIAIDYDGTITDDTPFPYEGKIRPEALKFIPLLYSRGYTLILWTARKQYYYNEAYDRLKKSGLLQYFSSIKSTDIGYTGKIQADYYIDDRACFGPLDWKKIYNYIISKED